MIFSGFGAKNIHLKNPIDFLFTFWPISKQTFDVQKNVEGLEWPAIDALRIGYHRFFVTSMVMNPQVKTCFVNKQLTYYLCCYYRATSPTASKHYIGCPEPLMKYFCWGWRFRGYLFPQPGVMHYAFSFWFVCEFREFPKKGNFWIIFFSHIWVYSYG